MDRRSHITEKARIASAPATRTLNFELMTRIPQLDLEAYAGTVPVQR